MPDPTFDTSKWSTTPPTAAPTASAGSGFDPSKWSTTPPPAKSGLAGPTEMRAYHPIARGVEEVGRAGAFGLGDYLGGPAGGGLGGTIADIGIALANKLAFGQPTDLSYGNIQKDRDANIAAAYSGRLLGGMTQDIGSGALKMARGEAEVGAGAQKAYAAADQAQSEASSKQAEKNLAERTAFGQQSAKAQQNADAQFAEQQQKVLDAKKEFHANEAQRQQDTTAQISKLKANSAKAVTPQAQASKVSSSFGRSPASSAAQLSEPADAATARKIAFRENMLGPTRRFSQEWGERRDKLLGPVMGDPVNLDPLNNAVGQQETWGVANNHQYSAPVRKLFEKTKALGATPAGVDMTAMLQKAGKKGGLSMTNDEWQALQAQQEAGEQAASGNTVRGLLGLRSEASRLAESSKGYDRTAMRAYVNGIDDSLAKDPNINAKLPQYQQLNAQWRHYKEVFDNFNDKVSDTPVPTEAAKDLFEEPRRAVEWLGMKPTPKEKLAARDLYADYVQNGLREGKSLPSLINPAHADFLKQLVPNTPFASEEGIRHLMTKEMAVEDVLSTSPEVRDAFMRNFVPSLRSAVESQQMATVQDALKQAKSMGSVGANITRQIEGAQTPGDKFRVAIKAMTGADPDDLVKPQGQAPQMPAQKSPEAAGREAIIKQFPNAENPPTTPDEAAVHAIQTGQTTFAKGHAAYFIQRARAMWPIYLAIGGPSLASGRMSYSGVMLMLGGAQAASEVLKKSFVKSLEDPQKAYAFWQALNNPAAASSMNTLGRVGADAVMSDLLSHGIKKATGTSLEGTDAKPETGPGVESLEKSRADAIAPTPSAAARATDVMKDLSKDKSPDVSHDLNRGRLSLEEVNKILKTGSKTDAMAMLDHVPLSEAMDSLEVAGPDERKMLVPLVQQKMMQQFKGGQFNKTLAANLAKRFQAVQKGAVNVSEA